MKTYAVNIPPVEWAYIYHIISHDAEERVHAFMLALLRDTSAMSEFELGLLITAVSPLRAKMPIAWQQLMNVAEVCLAAREV